MEGITLQEHFASLEDPRVERTKQHQLLSSITIALCAVICGADTWVDVEEFGKSKGGWLETFLELPGCLYLQRATDGNPLTSAPS
jgi:DDE_Tnp_1-associated